MNDERRAGKRFFSSSLVTHRSSQPFSNSMNQEAVSKLGLEPGGLGRHDAARVRDLQEVFDGRRVERKGDGSFSFINEPFELRRAARSADEINALVRAHVLDAEHRVKQVILQQADIQGSNGVAR